MTKPKPPTFQRYQRIDCGPFLLATLNQIAYETAYQQARDYLAEVAPHFDLKKGLPFIYLADMLKKNFPDLTFNLDGLAQMLAQNTAPDTLTLTQWLGHGFYILIYADHVGLLDTYDNTFLDNLRPTRWIPLEEAAYAGTEVLAWAKVG